jgi:hypothetical protein
LQPKQQRPQCFRRTIRKSAGTRHPRERHDLVAAWYPQYSDCHAPGEEAVSRCCAERSHVPRRDPLRRGRGLKRTDTGQRFLEGFEAAMVGAQGAVFRNAPPELRRHQERGAASKSAGLEIIQERVDARIQNRENSLLGVAAGRHAYQSPAALGSVPPASPAARRGAGPRTQTHAPIQMAGTRQPVPGVRCTCHEWQTCPRVRFDLSPGAASRTDRVAPVLPVPVAAARPDRRGTQTGLDTGP